LYTRGDTYAGILSDLLWRRWERGDEIERLEALLCQRFGVPDVVAVNQARVGIHLAMRAVLQPGQEVVLSPYTIADVVNMVVAAGGKPVFADICADTHNLDVDQALSLLSPNTGAVLVTHLHGLAVDVVRLADACRARGVALIEDCAQALGARNHGRAVGTFGDAAVVSFGMYKNVSAVYGGAVLCKRADIAGRVRAIQAAWPSEAPAHFLKKMGHSLATDIVTYPPLFSRVTYPLFRFAHLKGVGILNKQVQFDMNPTLLRALPLHYQRRMTPSQARLVLRGLPRLDPDREARVRSAHIYHAGLVGIPGLTVAPLCADGSHVYTYFALQCDRAQDLVRHGMQSGRDFAMQHLKNCADLPCFSAYARDCPNARRSAKETVLLPTYPRYSEAEVRANVAAVRAFFS
jgi:dTDP-4-amino-4,6-dideoxygalactose transaminase